MSNVGYATLTVIPSAKGFANALGKDVDGPLLAAGTNGGKKAAKGFGGGFLPLFKGMIGPAVGIAAGLGLGQGISKGLSTASFLEQAKISFETLLGDSGLAKKMISDVSAFAAKTPFELPGLTANIRSLLGAGAAAGSVFPTMNALGDATAALGINQEGLNSVVRAYTQMMGKGKISAEEMLQITEAGLPIWSILSRAMGKPVGELQKLASEGKLLSSDVLPLLEQQMSADYGGSMEKQAKTLSGVWSTVKDTVNIAMATALEPLVPLLTKILPPAAEGLSKVILGAGNGIVSFVETAGPGIAGFISGVQGLFSASEQGKGAFGGLVEAARPIADIFVNKIVPALGALGGAIVNNVGPIFQSLGDIIRNSIIPAVTQMISTAQPLFAQFGTMIASIAANVGPILVGVGDSIRNVWAFIGPFVIGTLQTLWNVVVGVLSGIFTTVQGFVTLVSGLFQGDWRMIFQGLLQTFGGVWQAVIAVLNGVLSFVGSVFMGTWGASWNWVMNLARTVGTNIGTTVAGFINTVRTTVSNGLTAVQNFFRSAWNAILSVVNGAVNGLKSAVSGGVSGVVGFVAGLPGKILSALGSLGGMLVSVGSNMMNGFIRGVQTVAGRIADVVLAPIKNAVNAVKGFLGIHSPSRLLMGIGINTGLGYANGLRKVAPAIVKASEVLRPTIQPIPSPNVETGVAPALAAMAASQAGQGDRPLVGKLFLDSGEFLGVIEGKIADADEGESIYHLGGSR